MSNKVLVSAFIFIIIYMGQCPATVVILFQIFQETQLIINSVPYNFMMDSQISDAFDRGCSSRKIKIKIKTTQKGDCPIYPNY